MNEGRPSFEIIEHTDGMSEIDQGTLRATANYFAEHIRATQDDRFFAGVVSAPPSELPKQEN